VPAYLLVAAFVLGLALGGGGGWQVRAWKAGADKADELQQAEHDRRRQAEHVDQAASRHEHTREQLRAQGRVISQEVDRVVEKPFYRDRNVCLDDDGLRSLAAAIAGTPDPGKPAAAMPAASGSH